MFAIILTLFLYIGCFWSAGCAILLNYFVGNISTSNLNSNNCFYGCNYSMLSLVVVYWFIVNVLLLSV